MLSHGHQRSGTPRSFKAETASHCGNKPKRIGIATAFKTVLVLSVLLAHLGEARAEWDSGSQLEGRIEDPSRRALLAFYGALTRTLGRTGPEGRPAVTRLLHYGDSHVAARILTGALRERFQLDFGNAGPGFLLPGATTGGGRWQTTGANKAERQAAGRSGLAGVSLTTTGPGERIWLLTQGQRFDLYLLKQPGGGEVAVRLDGSDVARLSLDSITAEASYLTVNAEWDSLHSIELRGVTAGPVTLFGVAAERAGPGVVYDALGINGARATRPLHWDWDILTSNLARRSPDLIVIAYGSNEVTDPDLDLTRYEAELRELLARFRRAAPQASLLVTSPPDRAIRVSGHWRSVPVMAALVRAQRRAAFSSGAAFWDLFQAMGGPGSIDRWARLPNPYAQADRVHLTRRGYRAVADALYTELTRGYLEAVLRSLMQRLGLSDR